MKDDWKFRRLESCEWETLPSKWFKRLDTMFAPMVWNHTVERWWDGQITPGQEWLTDQDGS
jgi:hypothetical protein